MKIDIQLDEGAYKPSKAYKADAGWDLYSTKDFKVIDYKILKINTGVHFQIPEGFVGLIFPRSSISNKDILIPTGVIDSGYTGSVYINLAVKSGIRTINKGDRIAQIVFIKIPSVELEEVDVLNSNTLRGSKGYGSSGI